MLLLPRQITQLISEVPLPLPGRISVKFQIYNRWVPVSLSATRHPLCSTLNLWPLVLALGVSNLLLQTWDSAGSFLKSIFISCVKRNQAENVVALVTAVLCEERLLFHSSSLSQLALISQTLFQVRSSVWRLSGSLA